MVSKQTATEVAMLEPRVAQAARENAEAEVKSLTVTAKSVPAVIKTQDDLDVVSDFTQKIATTKKNIIAEEKKATKPLDQVKKLIKSWFKPMHDELDYHRGASDQKILGYEEMLCEKAEVERQIEVKKEEKRLAALRRNEEKKLAEARSREERARVKAAYKEKQEAVANELNAALNQIVEEEPQMQGVSIVKRWKVELVNIDDVPREYLRIQLNEKLILDTCREQAARGQEPRIRGLRFFQESSTAAKSLN